MLSFRAGEAGVDYPNFSVIPKTEFNCSEQRYKGFFGDPSTGCQGKYKSILDTIFSRGKVNELGLAQKDFENATI